MMAEPVDADRTLGTGSTEPSIATQKNTNPENTPISEAIPENNGNTHDSPSNMGPSPHPDMSKLQCPPKDPVIGQQLPQPLSKNAQKRLRRMRAWEEKKQYKKQLQKQKKKEMKEKKRDEKQKSRALEKEQSDVDMDGSETTPVPDGEGENNAESEWKVMMVVGQKRKGEERNGAGGEGVTQSDCFTGPLGKKAKILQVQVPITIIIDCGFDDLMTDKEIISLSSQLTRSYSDNRTAPKQVSLYITSLNKRLAHRMETTLRNHHTNWKKVRFSKDEYEVTQENREKGDLIYLTSDSEFTLEELEEGKSYIVGGIVDRNRHKGLCYRKAQEQGIRTAKLPIGEYIRMSSRFVLTTNQVIEIMLKWLELRDWKEAFLKVIPPRKQPEAADNLSSPQPGIG
ncbi:guanine-1-methyltransferase-domain-containing protein [Kalaharituber pfeilii]|nr:guanine-1-methyltransferase-domain-containing protein [Kalaharituber pfeilii]